MVAGTLFALAGAMFVASGRASESGELRVDSTGGLQGAITARSSQNAQLRADVDRLGIQVAALQEQAASGPALQRTQDQIAEISPAVGLTEVIGPGVTVTLNDAKAPDPLPEGRTGDDYIVHQQDVQGVVNALWRGGASGVTVMGQRLLNTSAVRCVGNTVILQGRVYSPPFVIAGVGDVASLEAALEVDESVREYRDWAEYLGLGYIQTASPRMVLPPYTGPLALKYAEVIP